MPELTTFRVIVTFQVEEECEIEQVKARAEQLATSVQDHLVSVGLEELCCGADPERLHVVVHPAEPRYEKRTFKKKDR